MFGKETEDSDSWLIKFQYDVSLNQTRPGDEVGRLVGDNEEQE